MTKENEGDQVRWPSLRYLDLSHNKISELKTLNCHKLKYLDLSNNILREISSIEGSPELIELNLSYNQLSECQSLKDHQSLEIINLVISTES